MRINVKKQFSLGITTWVVIIFLVKIGGHFIPEDKIVSRYKRSLDLLEKAISFTNRAYIFDNSGEKPIWLAEITNGKILETKTQSLPEWFENLRVQIHYGELREENL